MPPMLIPPSFPIQDDADFDADFDLPAGHSVLTPSSVAVTLPVPPAPPVVEEDWDDEFAPDTIVFQPMVAPTTTLSGVGKVTHLGSKHATSRSGAPPPSAPEDNWDDDEDFDLPPVSSKPLKLSLSPRTKIRMEKEAATAAARLSPAGQDSNLAHQETTDDDDAGNASTIKVSRLALTAALHSQLASSTPSTPPKPWSARPSAASSPAAQTEEDFLEDDILIPNDLSHLSLKLTHRESKISLDGWGDSTSSTLFSDASSSTLSQPSPCTSAAPSAPTTEDECDDDDVENDLEGLEMPESLSSKDMNRILDNKKKGVSFETKDSVKVARPSDGEDDFEMGLVIGTDEDLSPSRLKGQQQALLARKPGKPGLRTMSDPAGMQRGPALIPRPPSRLREEITPAIPPGRSSRDNARSPSLVLPPSTAPAPAGGLRTRPSAESFPSLRRAPSNLIGSSRQPTRWQTMSTSVRPSTLPSLQSRPLSPSKVALPPPANSPSPYPRSPSPMSATSSTAPSSRVPSMSVPRSSQPPPMKSQKSFSKLPAIAPPPPPPANNTKRLTRKASLSSLVDSPSSPELVRPKPGLSHTKSYRDLGGTSVTVGPSTTLTRTPLERTRFAYEAPTVASRVRRAATKSGTMSDGGAMSGSDRERERDRYASRTTSTSKPRPAISSIFPTTVVPPARSPSPRLNTPLARKPSTSFPPINPSPRIMRKPKKSRVFGDGSELDAIEDLAVEREKESMYRVVPSGRGNVGSGGTIGRKKGSSTAPPSAPAPRSVSSASESAPPAPAPRTLRRQATRIEFPRVPSEPAPVAAIAARKTNRRLPSSSSTSSVAAKKKPTLIKNLSGAGSPKVVGDMKWNPKTLRWEGNESVLRDFELTSSARPALITQLTGSSLASPPGSSALVSNARVVGEMMFDPIKMCWLSRSGEDEEDPFAGIDDDDELSGDAWEDKGATIRGLVAVAPASRRESEEGGSSPARSRSGRGSTATTHSHARSASESDTEAGTTGRLSSLGPIDESDVDGTVPIPRELVAACVAAEERHRSEMRGWCVTSSAPSNSAGAGAIKRRVSVNRIRPPVEEDLEHLVADRSYLWDIRALATRNY